MLSLPAAWTPLRPWQLIKLTLALLAAVSVGACSMAGSALLDPKSPQSCAGNLGPYYLSRSLLRVEVKRYPAGNTEIAPEAENRFRLVVDGLHREADPERFYCLDYLQVLTSDDLIRVWRNNQGLLQKISSDANDQSAEIFKTIIQTIFTAISGNPDFDPLAGQRKVESGERGTGTEPVTVFEAKFDPTNGERLAYINDHLRRYGFCIITKVQYEALSKDTKGAIRSHEAYCEDPRGYLRTVKAPPAAARKPLEISDGIVYRPQLPYDVFLLQKSNQKLDARRLGSGEKLWLVTKRKLLLIENDAPAIAARIDRTFFAQRTTTLNFENGILKEVKLQKEAELVKLVEIPLQIAESIASLPANIIKVRIDQSKGQDQLILAETRLMQAQYQLLQRDYVAQPLTDTEKQQLYSYIGKTPPTLPPVRPFPVK
jgi:hypothetical protein